MLSSCPSLGRFSCRQSPLAVPGTFFPAGLCGSFPVPKPCPMKTFSSLGPQPLSVFPVTKERCSPLQVAAASSPGLPSAITVTPDTALHVKALSNHLSSESFRPKRGGNEFSKTLSLNPHPSHLARQINHHHISSPKNKRKKEKKLLREW